ncbi:MAG: ABC transporter permease subunit [Lachnospiraceae bacterium]|nr:ABC transporter permease subunit [Lachnospiraceae bacterium]
MTLWKQELRAGRVFLAAWAAAVAFLTAICILIYPEMAGQMEEISGIFSQMGGFSQAFGMDRLSFGEFLGFFGVECGNVLGLGGALFAALIGIQALAREEKEHTAEFLLTHPVSRTRVVFEKLLAVFTQIFLLNAAVLLVTLLSVALIGESPDGKTLALLFLAYFLLQLETAAVCFGISAFLRQGGPGLGLGIAALFYFLNLVANLTRKAEFLKYLTPFGYAESADVIMNGRLSGGYLAAGLFLGLAGVAAAFWWYERKDIA